jgi:EmrB/QacA subfamily drug resistance transporter
VSAPDPRDAAPAPGSLAALQALHGPRYRWLLLASVMVGSMASIMSATVVNVAIPDLSSHFRLDQAHAQWVSSGFMAAMTVSMLATPWLLMRLGYRSLYAACMWLLLAGGVVGGVADSYGLVLAARLAEGLAAGVVQPIPAIIIMRAFAPHEQGRASGLFGMVVVLAPALGPSLGGVLVQAFGWRSIFFMVVPFCVAGLWAAHRYVPTTAPGGVAASRDTDALDWRGLLMCGTCVCALLLALVRWHEGQLGQAGSLAALTGASLALFVWWQRRLTARGVESLIALALFDHRRFVMGAWVALIYGMALFGSTYLVPVYMQLGLGLSAATVGAVLLPSGIALALCIAWVGRLADRQPAHRLVTLGLGLLSLSFALMLTVPLGAGLGLLLAWTMLGRIGLGFVLPSLNLGALRGLPLALLSHGSSTINFVRTLGGAAGVGLCGIALQWRVQARGTSLVTGAPDAQRLAAFGDVFAGLAVVCALAMWAAWHLRDSPDAGAAAPQ